MNEESIQKYIKQVRTEANEDMKQHIGALIENVNDKFKATNEKLITIDKKLDSQEEMIAGIAEEKTLVKVQVSDHENRINTLETNLV
ncbi:MAG: hypothetical protein A3A96_00240 [Candidatus Zambryskibacteria bacterium RIFCSPLOWO2_01_FULL_39_39]|uniref:Uncharacterized protein n=1 Tax=Candidatus Zambryskibacteria bacterium RIFCSPLOWO2_01_FULL_39_39 TaxID=1802758 RepID=A0A1G2TX41_9BACT|nr:MAG: hypothetical protein UT00_C0001G0053 [Parcubacteria group bacterium GW2011_GWA1_38_7]OHA87861.1 MAG: hypothetical protein A2644_01655 [Candidatus Zambryskibacteria bacterium RIFCSPHIGHO2_01_FULL_39_63]OHA94915.1 MAG: hypothetical protein A3B88_00860 [Candidatus Zambryskibacteria bacterium RIFCSPHIGHO2_02_FULL_39_19]OHA99095.1 MAG: hypothetical protein A3F20_02810 [Candidatus Zambryskibacteria bacterium RIFCSPHIGHO2_12_FULL_39_21]OHB01857.1 MAG: hypothetical protein A3A96_00240 [Candidat